MDRDYVQPRRIGRRETDQVLWDQLCRYQRLYRVGQIISSEMDPDRLFRVIREETAHVMETERNLLFLYDAGEDRLRSVEAGGTGGAHLWISPEAGVAGWVFRNQTHLVVHDPYGDSRFDPEVDQVPGLITRNLLSIPLMNRENRCIGVLEALNKRERDFDDEDQATLSALSHYIAIAVENSRRYQEVEKKAVGAAHALKGIQRILAPAVADLSRLMTAIGGGADSTETEHPAPALASARRQVDRLAEMQDRIEALLRSDEKPLS